MKILAALLFFFSAPSWAGQWVSIEANHANLLYSEGEAASFVLRKIIQPISPDYSIETKVSVNGGAEVAIEYHEGFGAFISNALAAGETIVAINTKIYGPSGFEKAVQSDSIQLTVNLGGVSQ